MNTELTHRFENRLQLRIRSSRSGHCQHERKPPSKRRPADSLNARRPTGRNCRASGTRRTITHAMSWTLVALCPRVGQWLPVGPISLTDRLPPGSDRAIMRRARIAHVAVGRPDGGRVTCNRLDRGPCSECVIESRWPVCVYVCVCVWSNKSKLSP